MQLLVRQMVPFIQRQCSGLTLIEVLIGMAIVSIALAAIIKTTTQNIQATKYLQDKTMATWVGQQVLNEVRVGVLTLPSTNDLKQKTVLLGRDWYWESSQEETANSRIKKITVNVYAHENVDQDEFPLINLESYIYGKE